VGAWDTSLFTDETAANVRDDFIELVGEGLAPETAPTVGSGHRQAADPTARRARPGDDHPSASRLPAHPAAIFLVVTPKPEASRDAAARELFGDMSSLLRAAGFRDPGRTCVVGMGSNPWDGPFSHWKSDRFTGAEVLKAAECALRQMLQEQCLAKTRAALCCKQPGRIGNFLSWIFSWVSDPAHFIHSLQEPRSSRRAAIPHSQPRRAVGREPDRQRRAR
jgi:hypothetical protein